LLAEELPVQFILGSFSEIRFSPDSRRVAVAFDHDTLVVASIQGAEPVFVELKRLGLEFARVYGWTEDGTEVIVGTPGWKRIEGTAILAFNPDTEDVRPVFESPQKRAYIPDPPYAHSGLRVIPLALIDQDEEGSTLSIEMKVIDIRTGEVTVAYRAGCGMGIDIAEDSRRMVFIDCVSDDEDDHRSRIHFFDLASGTDVATVDLDGRAWSTRLSPTGEWAVVSYVGEPGDGRMKPAAVHVSGRVHSFEDGWSPIGWAGRTSVVLAGYDERRSVDQLALTDIETGETRQVFP
jgi:hypothetical protein